MCEELLDTLPQCGSKAFDLFCDALKADGQEEIVTLYLKPSQPEPEAQNNGSSISSVQETSSKDNASNQIQSRVVTPQGTSSLDLVLPKEDGGSMVVTDSGIGCVSGLSVRHGSSLPHPVAVHEEYQRIRRIIEPVHADRMIPGTDGKYMDVRARYQGLPDDHDSSSQAIFSLVTDNSLSLSEKERMLLSMGIRVPVTDILQGFRDSKFDPYKDFMHSKYGSNSPLYKDSFNNSDRFGGIETAPPSPMHPRNAPPQNVFNQSPKKPNIPYNETIGQFIFRSKEQVTNNLMSPANEHFQGHHYARTVGRDNEQFPNQLANHDVLKSQDLAYRSYMNQQDNYACRNFREDLENKPMPSSPNRRFNEHVDSRLAQKEEFERFEKYQQAIGTNSIRAERDFFEIPRHVELKSSKPDERTMLSLPRYIEKQLPVSRHPDREEEEEEFSVGQATPKLARNDSVGKY